MSWEIRQGDALERLRELEPEGVQTVVTSPPYWGLRDYGDTGQLGLEPTPEQYVANLVEVFREVRRVLRKDGTVWLNLGDSYISNGFWPDAPSNTTNATGMSRGAKSMAGRGRQVTRSPGLKPKDLCGIPWRVAFALQAGGWWLRSDIIWSKPNPMPESVTDRPTRAHEYLFLLTKSARYFYDADVIREEHTDSNGSRLAAQRAHGTTASGEKVLGASLDESPYLKQEKNRGLPGVGTTFAGWDPAGRNRRSVWEIATAPYAEAHFATFPPKLVEPCILAGSPPKCCGECGAPWERVTKRERTRDGEPLTGAWAGPDDPRRLNATGVGHWRDETNVETLGWRPMCRCGLSEGENEVHSLRSLDQGDKPLPLAESVVLDPFCGSGTTGVVALRHDRSFIGIELNPAYCELARNRIRDDAPLLNTGLEVAA